MADALDLRFTLHGPAGPCILHATPTASAWHSQSKVSVFPCVMCGLALCWLSQGVPKGEYKWFPLLETFFTTAHGGGFTFTRCSPGASRTSPIAARPTSTRRAITKS